MTLPHRATASASRWGRTSRQRMPASARKSSSLVPPASRRSPSATSRPPLTVTCRSRPRTFLLAGRSGRQSRPWFRPADRQRCWCLSRCQRTARSGTLGLAVTDAAGRVLATSQTPARVRGSANCSADPTGEACLPQSTLMLANFEAGAPTGWTAAGSSLDTGDPASEARNRFIPRGGGTPGKGRCSPAPPTNGVRSPTRHRSHQHR